jgi:hypothetical protein
LTDTFGDEPGFQKAAVGTDRAGRSRGYAILTFDSAETAQEAITKIDKSQLDVCRKICIFRG